MRKEADKISKEDYLEYLINNYKNLIFSICYKLTQDYFKAEDLAQETFLSAFKNLASFDGNHEKTWLSKIALNKCLDEQRRKKKQGEFKEEEFWLKIEDEKSSLEDKLVDKEVKEKLKSYCERLNSPYKEVALEYFYKEKDFEEIAYEKNKKLKTIQTQVYRAKAKLKKLYRRE